MSTSFFAALDAQVAAKDSLLCVGLDPHGVDLGDTPSAATALAFCTRIVEATSAVAVCYKPNSAFFEALGPEGQEALIKLIKAVPAGIPVLLDAKRGDISSTADAYATAAFEVAGAHAVTVHPYMGSDSVTPFTKHADKAVFVLCKTSNPSSNEFETLKVDGGKALFEVVASKCEQWNSETKNVGIVVGATDTDALLRSRAAAPSVWILAPGVGFQGGNLDEAVRAGLREDGSGLLVPVSRGISRATDMAAAAVSLKDQINAARAASKEPVSKKPKTDELAEYQRDFFKLAIQYGVLAFGTFTLKSGRSSPYFFNAGKFASGLAMCKLGEFYARAIKENGLEYDVMFGPAYKGIPLVSVISAAMYSIYGEDVPMAYNRKEAKDHGEGGTLVGTSLEGKRVLVLDDTITAGTAIRESVKMIEAAGGKVSSVVVALDREEKVSETSELSAIQGIQKDFGVKVVSIVGLRLLLSFLKSEGTFDQSFVDQVQDYRSKYGATETPAAAAVAEAEQ